MQPAFRFFIPVFIVFLLFLVIPFALSEILVRYHIDKNVILFANGLFFTITLISFFIQKRGMENKNAHVFIRSVTGGMMIKMLFCILAVSGYVYYSGAAFNKRAVFISLLLYLVYLSAEVMSLMKMNKKQHA